MPMRCELCPIHLMCPVFSIMLNKWMKPPISGTLYLSFIVQNTPPLFYFILKFFPFAANVFSQ